MRIVSLLPSATEIVCALGAADQLVGISHECDHPPAVRDLPRLTRAKIRVDGSSAAIDRDVRALVAQGLSVYEIDVARLRALAPDVVVTQQQCEVCAVSFAEVEAATREALDRAPVIVSLTPRTLGDVWADIRRVATVLGREGHADALLTQAEARLAAVRTRSAALPRPVVACVEWLDPPMAAANWIPEMVEMAGGAYPFATRGAQSCSTSWRALAAAAPEVVVLMPCGFTVAQTQRELAALVAREEWRTLPAVRAGRASVVDGNAYFNRPGPRLVDSTELLAQLIQPAAFPPTFGADAVLPLGPS